MLKQLKHNVLLRLGLCFTLLFLGMTGWADEVAHTDNALYVDSTKLVSQQVDLIKNRLLQAQNELAELQHQQEQQIASLSVDSVSKPVLIQAGLNIAIAKSNLDSIDIELSESQQTVARLEKEIQELENQLNVSTMFGLKWTHGDPDNFASLKNELAYQQHLYELEKERNDQLTQLRTVASDTLRLYKMKHARIHALLKSRTILRLKEKQARSEVIFQQQQSY